MVISWGVEVLLKPQGGVRPTWHSPFRTSGQQTKMYEIEIPTKLVTDPRFHSYNI